MTQATHNNYLSQADSYVLVTRPSIFHFEGVFLRKRSIGAAIESRLSVLLANCNSTSDVALSNSPPNSPEPLHLKVSRENRFKRLIDCKAHQFPQ